MTKKAPKHPLRNLDLLALIVVILAVGFKILVVSSYLGVSVDIIANVILATAGLYLLLTLMVTGVYALADRRAAVTASPIDKATA